MIKSRLGQTYSLVALIAFGATYLLFFMMWLSSYTHYTSIGIDHMEQQHQTMIDTRYRIRWPGNGAFVIGISRYKKALSTSPIERWDLGAAVLRPAQSIRSGTHWNSKSHWNQLGFWRISQQEPTAEEWLGIPSWVPVALLTLLGMAYWRRFKPYNINKT